MQNKRILGVDPGTNLLGYAVIEKVGTKLSIINLGVLNLQKFKDPYLKLKKIHSAITSIVNMYEPAEFAIESPFFGVNVQSMLKLGRAQGVAIAAALNCDLPITEYAPRKIKQAITGTGTATKLQVAAMLKQLFSLKEEITQHDASDALAIALCHHYSLSSSLVSNKAQNWSDFIKNNPQKIIQK